MDWTPADVAKVESVLVFNEAYVNITWLHTSGEAVISTGHPMHPQVEYLLDRAKQERVTIEECD